MAFGIGQWPHRSSGAFGDWWPLALVVVSLLLIRFAVRLPVTWPTAIVAIAAGTVWGSLTERWGIFPPAAVVLILVVVATWTHDRFRNVPA